ncbi:MAG: aminotransferase class III-fold pyridoxal phosphate-dependent enzyme [Proteobacteria bacterium]|nr:aminotransferase class III-fold pyridoxal phosphate-dependent enzyme [Pseudomonadota bacterium]
MDFEDIISRAKELIAHPVYSVSDDMVSSAVEKIKSKTPKSAGLFNEAKECIPGGSQHMMACGNPHSITIKRSFGAEMWDVDGNQYLDYMMAMGPIILGHNYPPLIDKMIAVIRDEGVATGLASEWEIKGSRQIKKHFKSIDRVRYFQSGTEADMAAARLARAYTGKKKIVRVGGAYHGWSSEFLFDMQIPYSGPFQTAGVPEEYYMHVVAVPPNDVGALESAFKEAEQQGGVAALFLEPSGPETGAIPIDPGFNRIAREVCDQHKALLVFDEVVTGFRLAMGGAQEFYNVEADLTVLGKLITHGFPSSGALGGREEIMDCLAGLPPGKPKPFVAGTVAANPISTAATYWAVKFIEEENAIEKANQKAIQLSDGLNEIFERLKLPFFSHTCASLVHFETTAPLFVDIRNQEKIGEALARKQAVDDLSVVLLAEGIQTKYGARAFTCMAHTDENIAYTLEVFENIMGHMIQK